MDKTSEIPVKSEGGEKSNSNGIPEEAFLVLEGDRVFPLLQAIINIGRRIENDVVIEDARVSRYHSQLRVINGRYELFDLSSSGGTYINGARISQSVIYPGDVISLAGFKIIYRQHNVPTRADLWETSKLQHE